MIPSAVSVEIRRAEDLDKIIWFNLRSWLPQGPIAVFDRSG